MIQSGTGYGGHDALAAHFGLGDATAVDSLIVEWPSGILESLTVAVDQWQTIVEGATRVGVGDVPVGGIALSIGGAPGTGRLRAIVQAPMPVDGMLDVLDAMGRRMAPTLRRSFAAGRTEVAFGDTLRPGIYWVRLRAGDVVRTARAVQLY